jgi:hypothetical protein
LKNNADFLNGVQVEVEILTSKIRMKTAINLKMALVKNGVEYF